MTRQSSYLSSPSRTARQQLPRPLAGDWDWQLSARCTNFSPEVFFPEEDGRRDQRRREEAAKRICWGCPVIARCLEHALRAPENHGVWGATTANERARTR
ncbi:WhiB family transcriptional regulator [Candidatus Mycolicibacterium alkanivorans]|uniref:Transcriptional regulator WhiB n=1 Tax=Candidatus Mycolicibacterium alkanivorans TaxID=2954114 RepID=A0ABS9YSY8_9MYCO|nr:WhiB family transcriptional regulator [Candidatus Mycolicibacterium alkanivorans]MCI4674341.1 WhiB family transcriptional regulator [Candidatus Mycolicibacterium alkanivorans]